MSVPPAPGGPAPLVTCVLTAFNYARYVDRAVASALQQRGLPAGAVEVVAVDDGSTDGTLELLEAMGPPVRVLRQQGLGPTVGTYRGIDAARGRYVAFLDADDQWMPDKLARQIALLEARPEVGIVYGDLEIVDGDGRVLQPSNFAWTRQTAAVGRVLGTFLGRNLAATSSILLQTELARSLPHAPDWAWCRDWWVAAHVATTHELDCILDPVVRYRMHGSNLSALDDGQREKTLKLWHRDLRVRRILLRELDLSSVTLEDIQAAWQRFGYFLGQVAGGRGVPPTEILPVTAEDRAEAAAALHDARAKLHDDPLAAGHAAARALGADPFGADAVELLAGARDRASAVRRRPQAVSVAQADRIRELDECRAAVRAATVLPQRLDVFSRFDRLYQALAGSGTSATELAPCSDAERNRALTALETGLQAVGAGRHGDAAGHFAVAVADRPADGHARVLLDAALARLAGHAQRQDSAEARAAHESRPAAELDGSGTFVGLAFADELGSDPSLLGAWAATVGEDDDATLVIYAPGRDEAAVADALMPALAAAGIGDDDARDLALVVGPATPEREAGLARGASTLLTRRTAPGPFAALPVVSDPDDLRERSERRLTFDGLGRSATVAVKLCAQRWDDAHRAPDLSLARAVCDELARRGHRAVLQVAAEWHSADARACDAALHVRGPWPYLPLAGQSSLLWAPAGDAADVTPREAALFDVAMTSPTAPSEAVDRLLEQLAHPASAGRQTAGRA
jgi:hypothetical protein